MKICIFPVGAFAGYPSYLIEKRKDRVAYYVGDTLSFSSLRASLPTQNPVTTGCFAWECSVQPELALSSCQYWIQNWMIGGADPAAVPFLIVIHTEPCPWSKNGLRTVAHWVVSNVHLGLKISFRPYVHWRDFTDLLQWQNTLNLRDRTQIPSKSTARFGFARAENTTTATILCLLREVLYSIPDAEHNDSFERKLECVVNACNASGGWDEVCNEETSEHAFGHAILSKHNDTFYLQFQNGRRITIGRDIRSKRARARAAIVRIRTIETSDLNSLGHKEAGAIFDQLAKRRSALFLQNYNHGWFNRIPIPDYIRDYLGNVRNPNSERPAVYRESDVAIGRQPTRTNEPDQNGHPREY